MEMVTRNKNSKLSYDFYLVRLLLTMLSGPAEDTDHHRTFFARHAQGYWRRAAVVSWIVSLVAIYITPVNVMS